MADKDFELALEDLQNLVSNQHSSLETVMEFLEAGKEEEALKALKEALEGSSNPPDAVVRACEAFPSDWVWSFELAEDGKTIQIIKTGQFEHPQYGKMTITLNDLKEMKKNFNDNVRGQQIPIDVDHKHELGAARSVRYC
jgi:hypothetical protein